MSKEAKIGLLLGLIFIVAIAVILKGVHRDSINDLGEKQLFTGNQPIRPEPLPLNVVHNLTEDRLATSPLGGNTASNEGTLLPASGDSTAGQQTPVQPGATNTATANLSDTIRYQTRLPNGPASLGNSGGDPAASILPGSGIYESAVKDFVNLGPISSIKPAAGNGFYAPDNNKTGPSAAVATAKSTTQATPLPGGNTVASKTGENSRNYKVAKGDDLSRIAQKVYGSVEGKKWVNIKGIFDANTKIMKDINSLSLDQELIIPALKNQPVAVTAEKPATPAKASADTLLYTVEKGDNLWSIAQKKLGNGNRYNEIVSLNGSQIGKNNSLKAGSKIKLPAK